MNQYELLTKVTKHKRHTQKSLNTNYQGPTFEHKLCFRYNAHSMSLNLLFDFVARQWG